MAEEIKLSNIPCMPVGDMVEELSNAYCALIKGGAQVKMMPSVMLWGAPGVGKSQGIRQIAKKIEADTGKKTFVTDVRLLLFNPIDLRGIPTSNADKTLAVWLKPQIFQMDESEDVINILFLDEISAAPQSVQAAAYQITLDRVVGEHKLPDNCIVIAAGNRTTDKSVAYKMPKALANRLMHIEVEVSLPSWTEWAKKNGINKKVIDFLNFEKESIMCFDSSSEELTFATPRSWEMVSNILNEISDDVSDVFLLIAGVVGITKASEFRKWALTYKDLPSIAGIFEGVVTKVPKEPDALYALTTAMTEYASENRNDLRLIRNSIRYANRFPPDFAVKIMKDYMAIEEGYKNKLMLIPEFAKLIQTKGNFLNGRI